MSTRSLPMLLISAIKSCFNRQASIFPVLRFDQLENCKVEQTTSRSKDPVEYAERRQRHRNNVLRKSRRNFSCAPVQCSSDDKQSTEKEATDLLTEGTFLLFDILPRKWEVIQPYYVNDINLRICSYNVLCQKIVERTTFLYGHLMNSQHRHYQLSWPYRSNLLAREFSLIGADIYCLQEVQYDHYTSFFEPTLKKAGYKGIFKKRLGPMVDGCAIFYRSSLELLHSADIEFVFANQQAFNQGNIAQLARFRTKDGKVLCISNTHLVFNKKLGHVKLAQAARLLTSIYEATCDNCPYILCGDFNMQPGSPLYNFISDGFLAFTNLRQFEVSGQGECGGSILRPDILPMDIHSNKSCRIKKCNGNSEAMIHEMKFASAYNHSTDEFKPEISAYQSKEACNPDFIFYSVEDKILKEKPKGSSVLEIKEGRLHLVRRLTLPGETVLKTTTGPWPNFTTPSDHIPLVVDFALF